MALDATQLRSSFELVVEREPQLTQKFYDRLFADYPEVLPLFEGTNRETQGEMLASAIVSVLDHLEDAPWLERELGALGARHVDYGVTTPMYDMVGASLLTTIKVAAGEDWTDNLEAQWTEAYGVIATLMQAGAPNKSAHA